MSESLQTTDGFIDVPSLPAFDMNDLTVVRRAFADSPALEFQQFWRSAPEPDFCAGTVRLAWRGNALCVFADLADADIFSNSKHDNEWLWELGDVFEVFVKPEGPDAIVEFQINPNRHRLCLLFENAEAVKRARAAGDFRKHIVSHLAIPSVAWLLAQRAWVVYAELPCDVPTLRDRELRVCFGRYDYTRGMAAPVISSTACLTQMDFHRQHEWHHLRFQRAQ